MAANPGPSGAELSSVGNRWIFTADQLSNTPSRKCRLDGEKESSYRQQAASLIQDMGQKLQVTQLCINTAIVYMHRFYMFHSFSKFNRTNLSGACLFLAAKVEEQPRKLEHIVRTGYMCTHRDQPQLDVKSDLYLELAQELVIDENILLQTLGFEITVDHPHTHIVKTCNLVRASKDLAQTSYFLATNSLHLTSMCLQYPPTVVACVCIHLACKWSSFEIPQSSEGKAWFSYVDPDVTSAMLEAMTQDFLAVLEKCPSKIRKKLTNHKSNEEMPTHIFSLENKRMSKGEAATTSTSQLPSTSRSGERPPSTTSVQPTTTVGDQVSDKERTHASSARAPVSTAFNSFKYTNHERTVMSETANTLASTSESVKPEIVADQVGNIKPSTTMATSAELSGVQGLRRVKTETSTLSTKEYFERKQREQQDREKAAVSIMQFKSEVAATSEHLQSPPSKMAKLEVSLSKLPDRIDHIDKVAGREGSSSMKVEPGSVDSPMMAYRRIGTETTTATKYHGVGDPLEKSSNIFDRMKSSESKISTIVAASISEGSMPHHNRPSDAIATKKVDSTRSLPLPVPATAAENFMQDMSSAGERSKHERRMQVLIENSTDPASGQKQTDRRRSSRRDSGTGTPLASPNKANSTSTGSDFGSPIPVIGGHMSGDSRGGGHKRKRSADSEHQQSPLKMKLPVPPAVSLSSHVNSPQKHHNMGGNTQSGHSGHHSRVVGPGSAVEQMSGASLSESQERIRLKVSLSEGRVEKINSSEVMSPSSAGASGVKLVLSKDKLSGAYQSGSNATEPRRHHRHHGEREHERHHHRSHKHHQQQQQLSDSDNGQHAAKNNMDGQQRPRSQQRSDSGSTSGQIQSEKHQRTSASSYGNGHHGNAPSSSAPYTATSRQVQVSQQQNSFSSTYRYAAMAAASIPPPPPPPPLPSDDPYATQPPLPPQ